MNFSLRVKNELARINEKERCCRLAELAALIRTSGSIELKGGNRYALALTSDSPAVTRKIFILLKELFGIHGEIHVQRGSNLKRKSMYITRLDQMGRVREVLIKTGIITEKNEFNREIPDFVLKSKCCRRAFLRGAFLSRGYVDDPEKRYQMELATENLPYAQGLVKLLGTFGVKAGITDRKSQYVVYVKNGDQIGEVLRIIGASASLTKFENVRIIKGMKNRVNRLVNFDTANLDKAVEAGLRQIKDIELIRDTIGIEKLPRKLQEVARLRLEMPEATLKDLGESMDPPLSKSAVNHRMRKIMQIADDIRCGIGDGTGEDINGKLDS